MSNNKIPASFWQAMIVATAISLMLSLIISPPKEKIKSEDIKQIALRKNTESRIKYFQDSRTNICFAYFKSSFYTEAGSEDVFSITHVLCDPSGKGLPLTESFE